MRIDLQSKEEQTGVFSRNAEAYRQRLDEAMRKGQAAGREAILDHLKPRPGMRIVDLCCGPGTLTIPMARELSGDGEVIGVDLAEGMLAAARQAIAGRSLPVRFLRMDVENLQFPPASFDAASCAHGLHLTANFGRVLREARRVLKPRGRFGASVPSGEQNQVTDAFGSVFTELLGPSAVSDELAAAVSTVTDLDRFRTAALAAGFRFVETERVEVETTWDGPEHYARVNSSWWTFAARLEKADEALRKHVLTQAEARVRQVAGDGPFGVPAAANVLRAEA
jgi:ubiquinone/menaquinone biosynthesis C-methylase UbiE